jgi:NTP pyrophosphatase (non-canonical NTP hydrolase)
MPNPNRAGRRDAPLSLNRYQKTALKTDKNADEGMQGLGMPLLGLFGETGSLVSALKRKRRDKDSYIGYEKSVVEEFGDTLWYFSNIASRANLELSLVAKRALLKAHNWDQIRSHEFSRFSNIQEGVKCGPTPIPDQNFENGVIDLGARVGLLLNDYNLGKISGNRDALSAHLVEIFRTLVSAADGAHVSLEVAARENLAKVSDRWPIKKRYSPLFDRNFGKLEQLPRRIAMRFQEVQTGGKIYVIQQCAGINIGDRLTDNKIEEDDYRFHDVFHLAYAAILGWSPVLRGLFKVKRKSNPQVDESQDGARATLIEEGISTWVFNYGLRLNHLKSATSVDNSLLTTIRDFVKGYEVEICALWQWEEAILEGFKCFRALCKHRQGIVIADLNDHSIRFET